MLMAVALLAGLLLAALLVHRALQRQVGISCIVPPPGITFHHFPLYHIDGTMAVTLIQLLHWML